MIDSLPFLINKLGFVAHYVSTNQTIKKVFWLLFLKKVTARAARAQKTPFFFLQSFFFWGYFFKRKSVKGISVSVDSATNYSNFLPFTHFFFAKIGTKKKFPKRNAEQGLRALDRAHYAWGATFKKVDETTGGCGANIVRVKTHRQAENSL